MKSNAFDAAIEELAARVAKVVTARVLSALQAAESREDRAGFAPILLRTAEAADLIAVAPQTLMNWRSTGGGPPWVRRGNMIRYRIEDLRAWVDRDFESGQ